jgi:hypothetical protein
MFGSKAVAPDAGQGIQAPGPLWKNTDRLWNVGGTSGAEPSGSIPEASPKLLIIYLINIILTIYK